MTSPAFLRDTTFTMDGDCDSIGTRKNHRYRGRAYEQKEDPTDERGAAAAADEAAGGRPFRPAAGIFAGAGAGELYAAPCAAAGGGARAMRAGAGAVPPGAGEALPRGAGGGMAAPYLRFREETAVPGGGRSGSVGSGSGIPAVSVAGALCRGTGAAAL